MAHCPDDEQQQYVLTAAAQWAGVLACLGCVQTGVAAQVVIALPPGGPIEVDGVVASGEWSRAATVGLGDLEMRFQHASGTLEVGLRTPPLFVASICVQIADEVHVFHASSALGHAVYARGNGGWELVQPFEWRLRAGESEHAEAARVAHLQRFGWVATTVTVGRAGETEFRIGRAFVDATEGIRLAVGLLLQGEGGIVAGWPMDAGADGCTQRATVAGPLPDRIGFDLANWARLGLE